MRAALYQPDIPQNTGTILRLCACLGVPVDIIDPAGFDISDRTLKRAALDYYGAVRITRHGNFLQFKQSLDESQSRLVLLTTRGETSYCDFAFRASDVLMVGRESAGVPESVHDAAACRLRIPIQKELRSLNVAVAMAMVLGEALRQTGGFSSLA